jgi:stage III sporulation protein AA
MRYREAVSVLPVRLRKSALALPDEQQGRAEELHLRVGQPLTVLLPEGELPLEIAVESGDLETLCDIATEFSRYAAVETLREGYLSVKGGFRIGLCGTAVIKDGVNMNLRQFSSATVRIAREQIGVADEVARQLFRNGAPCSTLILSPPGAGKTTLLRDLVRTLSAGVQPYGPQRISLIDERGEVAMMHRGEPQMDVGPYTDVLDACPKALGIPMVLRAMNPQIIAVDEITAYQDIRAMSLAAGCGVRLLATIHAADVTELMDKPLYRTLLEERIFRLAVSIVRTEEGRHYHVEELP